MPDRQSESARPVWAGDSSRARSASPHAGRDHGLVGIAIIGGGINGAGIARDAAGRVIFVNPYEKDLALIGTTDISYDGGAEDVAIDEGEIAYLFGVLRRRFRVPPDEREVVHAFSGVRPLYDDNTESPSAVTRDYVFEVHGAEGVPPLLSIFGGKITTYRRLAEHALQRLEPWFPQMSPAWTAGQKLPGGDIESDFDAFIVELAREYPDLPRKLVHHYARLYGMRARAVGSGPRLDRSRPAFRWRVLRT